jgi:uncharacterized protein (DUF1919 family)
MKKLLKKLPKLYEKVRLRSHEFVIISNNCWGFECYKTLNREYNTPFVGLFLYPVDYLKLLRRFDQIGNEPLRFQNFSAHHDMQPNYPIGIIFENLEIHFLHYSNEAEARDKWTRRLQRMKQSIAHGAEILFKMCDRDGCTSSDLETYHNLPVVLQSKRVSFGVKPLKIAHHVRVNGELSELQNQAVDGHQLYRKRYKAFDFAEWVVSGKTEFSMISRMLGATQSSREVRRRP